MAKLEELRLTPLVEQLTAKAKAKLNDLRLKFEVAEPRVVEDDEDPDWTYALVVFNLKQRSQNFDTTWDNLIREVYKGIPPEEATKVLLVPA